MILANNNFTEVLLYSTDCLLSLNHGSQYFPHYFYYYTLYSLSVFLLAKSLQLILEISAT